MRNVKFRCAPALSAADAKKKNLNQTILHSTEFIMAQYMLPLEQEILENM